MRFIFDRQEAKDKLAWFFLRHSVCMCDINDINYDTRQLSDAESKSSEYYT